MVRVVPARHANAATVGANRRIPMKRSPFGRRDSHVGWIHLHGIMHVVRMHIPLSSVNMFVMSNLVHLLRDFAYRIEVEVWEAAANLGQDSPTTCSVS